MIRLPAHVVGELLVRFPANSSHMCCVELALLASAGKGRLYTFFPRSLTDVYAMLTNPSKGETDVHGCHCLRDMAVRMREVIAWPWVGVCVPLALSLYCFQCYRIKFNLFFINYCIS